MNHGKIYAVGDIHGHYDKLMRAIDLIQADGGADAQIVFIGDLTDRGPDSPKVIETLMAGIRDGKNWTVIKGNHDRMFTRFMSQDPLQEMALPLGLDWLHERLGGRDTLMAYGVNFTPESRYYQIHQEALGKVPADHIAFLTNLPLHHQVDQLLFVHAGIRPKVSLPDQTEEDLLWIRKPFLEYAEQHPWFVVHGHTAIDYPTLYHNRLNLDGGVAYGRPLIPVVIDGCRFYALDTGRIALSIGG